jgi:hypothetical protein
MFIHLYSADHVAEHDVLLLGVHQGSGRRHCQDVVGLSGRNRYVVDQPTHHASLLVSFY